MSRDSDVALDGQAMKAMAKERREAAMAQAVQQEDGGWTKHTPWHWQRRVAETLLDYWPSKRKWQWQGRIIYGNYEDLTRFITREM